MTFVDHSYDRMLPKENSLGCLRRGQAAPLAAGWMEPSPSNGPSTDATINENFDRKHLQQLQPLFPAATRSASFLHEAEGDRLRMYQPPPTSSSVSTNRQEQFRFYGRSGSPPLWCSSVSSALALPSFTTTSTSHQQQQLIVSTSMGIQSPSFHGFPLMSNANTVLGEDEPVLPPLSSAETLHQQPTKKRKKNPFRLRNFLCMHPGCGKSFTDNAHLRDHTFVHTGEKNLSCQLCDKKFARLSTLHDHQRVHTGEKPYKCLYPNCLKRYSSRAALRFHVSSHAALAAGSSQNNAIENPIVQDHHEFASPVSTDGNAARNTTDASSNIQQHLRLSELLHRQQVTTSVSIEESPESLTTVTITPSLSFNEYQRLEETIRHQLQQITHLTAKVQQLQQRRTGHKTTSRSKRKQSTGTTATATNKTLSPHASTISETNHTPVTAVSAITAPVQFLHDGVKPFECRICLHRFANFYQLSFHAKQHPTVSLTGIIGDQQPLPVGPKFCPEHGCEYAESTGRSLRNLQTLKRHWQRRHQSERPYVCTICPAPHQKAFKTKENLKAHEKDCSRIHHGTAAPTIRAMAS